MPRVTVALPGGRAIPGRLSGRRRDADGRWWYEVAIAVPAAAVRPVDGEDYSQVPTERAPGKDWVLQPLPFDKPGKRALVLHTVGCWAAKGRLEAVDSDMAAVFIKEKWATACEACEPEPKRTRRG